MEKVEHIPDEEYVLRRIYPEHHNDGELDSTAFDDIQNKPSVHWEKMAEKEKIKVTFPGFDFFLRLKVGDIRALGHDVMHEPDEDHGDNSHCIILPAGGKWTRGKKRGLAGKGANPVAVERVDLPPKKEE